jgi:hypothetical protein
MVGSTYAGEHMTANSLGDGSHGNSATVLIDVTQFPDGTKTGSVI